MPYRQTSCQWQAGCGDGRLQAVYFRTMFGNVKTLIFAAVCSSSNVSAGWIYLSLTSTGFVLQPRSCGPDSKQMQDTIQHF